MNDLQNLIGLAGKLVNKLEKSLIASLATSEDTKTHFPYSSAKLGFVNNPG